MMLLSRRKPAFLAGVRRARNRRGRGRAAYQWNASTATSRARRERVTPERISAQNVAPVRRVGFLVTRQRFYTRDPARQGGIIHFERQETGGKIARFGFSERPQQDLQAREDHDVGSGNAF